MTSVKPGTGEAGTKIEEPRRARSPLVPLTVVLAVAVMALGAWVIFNASSRSDVPEGIEELLDNYLRAWEEKDESAIRQATTEDFVINEYIYTAREVDVGQEVSLFEHITDDIDGVVSVGMSFDWENEHLSDLLTTGEGPWVVSVEEHWTWATSKYEGTANYLIVDDGGTLKIANHYWAGIVEYEDPTGVGRG